MEQVPSSIRWNNFCLNLSARKLYEAWAFSNYFHVSSVKSLYRTLTVPNFPWNSTRSVGYCYSFPNQLYQFWTVFIKVKQALKEICVLCSYLFLCPGLTWDETGTENFLDPSSWEFLAFQLHISLCTVNSLTVATTDTIGESVQNHYWTKAINIFLDSHSHCKIHAE